MNFVLSQTSLKDFESGCGRKWYHKWILKEIPFYSNEMMNKGKYFEYLCVGGSAKEDDLVVDLPRKKNGDKYIDQVRIEEHASYFTDHLFNPSSDKYLGFSIEDVQIPLFNKDRTERGVLDIECSDKNKYPVIIDLKLTKDLTSTHHPMSWGHPEDQLDTTQAVNYQFLGKERYGVIPRFIYLVFDLSPQLRRKKFEVVSTQESFHDLQGRKDNLWEALDNNNFQWKEQPSKQDCEYCPLSCEFRVKEFKYEN